MLELLPFAFFILRGVCFTCQAAQVSPRYLEIRPVILSESAGSLCPASQILSAAKDDRQNASSPLNGKPYLQMSGCLRQGFANVFFLFPSPPQKKSKRACCRLGATAPKRQHALYKSEVGACCQSKRPLRSPGVSVYVHFLSFS